MTLKQTLRDITEFLVECSVSFDRDRTFSVVNRRDPFSFDFFIPAKKLFIDVDGLSFKTKTPVNDLQAAKDHERMIEFKQKFAEQSRYVYIRIAPGEQAIEKISPYLV